MMYSLRRSGNNTNNNNNNNNNNSSSGNNNNNNNNNKRNSNSSPGVPPPPSSSSSPPQDKYERFEAWLRENGAKFDLLELREYDCGKQNDDGLGDCEGGLLMDSVGGGGRRSSSSSCCEEKKEPSNNTQEESEMRGVHSRTHIPTNTICLTIPRRCLITVEMGQATPIGQAILNSDLDLDAPKHIFLMIYLLWDRKVNGMNSFFYPYYEILPKTLRNMPIFWSLEELANLEGSYLLTQIADRNDAIAADYRSICQIAPLAQICTLEEFKWARMCVCSRNFGLQIDGHRTSALVPHADMLNHYRPRETKWTFDEDRQAFTITTLQPIPMGAQVYDSYGQKCNHRFLLNYGFAVENNRELDGFCPDEVPLELYIPHNDPLFAQKLEFWTRGEGAAAAAAAAAAASTYNSTLSSTNTATTITTTNGTLPSSPPSTTNMPNFLSSPKRIRVCVSNNENTRLLFSLLRTIVCNREELRAVTSPVSSDHHHHHPHHRHSHHANTHYHHHPHLTARVASNPSLGGGAGPLGGGGGGGGGRSLFGLTTADVVTRVHQGVTNVAATAIGTTANIVSSSTSSSSPPSTTPSYYRTCRDIRHPISLRNEREAMRLLLKIISRQLAQYPTTLAQDESDLMDELAYPRFSNKRHAKIQVRGEKEVLHHFTRWARTALDVIDVIEAELKEEKGVEVQLVTQQQRSTTTESASSSSNAATNYSHASNTKNAGRNDNSNNNSHTANITTNYNRTFSGIIPTFDTTTTSSVTTTMSSTTTITTAPVEERPGFEYIIRRMEEDDETCIHHTILRYCADVLGSMRREEFKNMRRRVGSSRVHATKAAFEKQQQQQQQQQHYHHHHPRIRQQQQQQQQHQLQQQHHHQQQKQSPYGNNGSPMDHTKL